MLVDKAVPIPDGGKKIFFMYFHEDSFSSSIELHVLWRLEETDPMEQFQIFPENEKLAGFSQI